MFSLQSLPLILGLLLLFLETNAQDTDSLIEIIGRHESVQSVESAKHSLPPYVSKVDMTILDAARKLRIGESAKRGSIPQHYGSYLSDQLRQINDRGDIRVNVYLHMISDENLAQLNALGITIEYINKKDNKLVCTIPFDKIEVAASINDVKGIHAIPMPGVGIGKYTTAGDSILRADISRVTFGIDGTGVKVGVISNGVDHIDSSKESGDLPMSVSIVDNRFGGDEGTAMLEIVHDIAPGASLAFADMAKSDDDFNQNIKRLVQTGCNIIVDDIIQHDDPMFEDGTIAQEIDSVSAKGVTYVSAAQNEGRATWDGQGISLYGDGWVAFNGTDETNSVYVPAKDSIVAILQWADKWDLSYDDYDLYLFGSPDTTDLLTCSVNYQDGEGKTPLEIIRYANPSSENELVYFRIKMHHVPSPREMKLEVVNSQFNFSHRTEIGGLSGHAAAISCISVGALGANNPQMLEPFSNQGPSRIYRYDSTGEVIEYVDRQTPTICGIDGVKTYIGCSGIWQGGDPLFYGTSAAAPHIAGLAALLLSIDNSLNWQQVENLLTSTAVKLPAMNGENFTYAYGNGRADAYLSLYSLFMNSAPKEVGVANGETGIFTSPMLIWNRLPGAATYELQVSSSPSFSNFIFERGGIKDTSYALSGLSNNMTYYWRVNASNGSVTSRYSSTWSFTTIPIQFALYQNYPNPFNLMTSISFDLPVATMVSLKLFDILGREVVTVISEEMQAGNYTRQWNASPFASGVYFYRLQAGNFVQTKKLVLLK